VGEACLTEWKCIYQYLLGSGIGSWLAECVYVKQKNGGVIGRLMGSG
jgi:hypothetical protein